MPEKPNILLIISDQHNAKVLGCKGHPDVKTPNLDRLAEEGVRFDNAITQNPICTPSRISFLSGQYPHNHGYYALNGPNPGGLPTILGHFRRASYRTAAIGKIHCPEYWVEDDTDFFRETCAGCSVGGAKEYLAYLAEKRVREDHGALFEFGPRGQQTCDARASVMKYEDSMEGWAVRQAMNFMSQTRKESRPFFTLVSLPKPHQCYAPSEPFWSMYDESRLTLPPNTGYDMVAAKKAPHLRAAAERWRRGEWTLFEPRTFEAGRLRKLHGYLGCVSHVDHAVGELLQWLHDNDLNENTIVIYTSDHGDYACEHDIMEKAPGICSDAITRIPFIWRWTGHAQAGHVASELVEAVDLSTTLCTLAGLPPLETSNGKDLSPLLSGDHVQLHEVAVTEFAWSKSVRKGKYRLVFYPKEMFTDEYPEGFGELYDLEADPWEMRNLYFDLDYAGVVQQLRSDLLNWLVTTTRPTSVLGLPDFDGPQAVKRYNCCVNFDRKFHPSRLKEIKTLNYL